MTDSELHHYGVKGMKWGVRRNRKGRATSEVSDDYIESRVNRNKPTSALSNRELKKLNERLQLERNYKDLNTTGTLRKIKAGNAAVGTILAIGVTANTAMAFANTPAGQAIKNVLTRRG